METVSKPTYTAVCRRVGDWWAIDVPQIRGVHTQARRLDQVEAMARDAISLLRDVPADGFDVTVEPHLDEEAEQTVAASTDATRRARQATEEARRLQREAATTLLTTCGLTVRDAGVLLHVSPQRVSQLARKPAKTVADSPMSRSARKRRGG